MPTKLVQHLRKTDYERVNVTTKKAFCALFKDTFNAKTSHSLHPCTQEVSPWLFPALQKNTLLFLKTTFKTNLNMKEVGKFNKLQKYSLRINVKTYLLTKIGRYGVVLK